MRQETVGFQLCGLELLSFAGERKLEKTPIVDVLWFMPMQYSTKTEVAEFYLIIKNLLTRLGVLLDDLS